MSRRALSDLPPDTFDDGRDAERDEAVDEPEAELPDTETPEIDFDFEPGAVQAGTERPELAPAWVLDMLNNG